MLLNARHEKIPFCVPDIDGIDRWSVVIDTGVADGAGARRDIRTGDRYPLQGRSLAFLIHARNQA
jgi:hypothetical protein